MGNTTPAIIQAQADALYATKSGDYLDSSSVKRFRSDVDDLSKKLGDVNSTIQNLQVTSTSTSIGNIVSSFIDARTQVFNTVIPTATFGNISRDVNGLVATMGALWTGYNTLLSQSTYSSIDALYNTMSNSMQTVPVSAGVMPGITSSIDMLGTIVNGTQTRNEATRVPLCAEGGDACVLPGNLGLQMGEYSLFTVNNRLCMGRTGMTESTCIDSTGAMTRMPNAGACQVSDWSEWSSCNNLINKQTRTRLITALPYGGGTPCPATIHIRNCPVGLMSRNTWYTMFTRANSAYTITQSGSDPDVQLQLNSINTRSSVTRLTYDQKIQNNESFIVDFEIFIQGPADGTSFNVGGSSDAFNGEGATPPAFTVSFHLWPTTRARGIYLFDNTGAAVGYHSVNPSTNSFIPVRIIYNRADPDTWQVFYNGARVIRYTNPANEAWVSSSGSIFGFASRTGGERHTSIIRRMSVELVN